MGKDSTTTTEEGVAEGSGPCVVLKFAPSYDDSSNFGDYRLIKEAIITRVQRQPKYQRSGAAKALQEMTWITFTEDEIDDVFCFSSGASTTTLTIWARFLK